MSTSTQAPALQVRSERISCTDELLALLPADVPARDLLSWVRRGEGLIGIGEAAGTWTAGESRFDDAQRWWAGTVTHAQVEDEVGIAGSGLVCFGTFPFDAGSATRARLVVPRTVIGRRGDTTWRTTVTPVGQGSGEAAGAPASLHAGGEAAYDAGEITFADGALGPAEWAERVHRAVERIAAGDLEKVVLARDLFATASAPLQAREILRRLSTRYENTWTFAVDGMVGATPELLVRRHQGLVTSRVLAGTIRRTGDDERDLALAASLARSSKDLEEHEYAVRSVADALAPHTTSMNVPEVPFVLHLPNVMHLASDVAAVAANGATSLGLAAALHPSAAVGGTPTPTAIALIRELEGMDRGRYAGPVGWMDASGDGEWGIALRSGQFDDEDPRRIRLFAGCGIVADSDPQSEVAETIAKLLPMRDAVCGGRCD